MEKTLKISKETHGLLLKMGKKGETFDRLIHRIITKTLKNSSKSEKNERK